ncbi:di-heme oxidoredictase family protein [soil metagenome]
MSMSPNKLILALLLLAGCSDTSSSKSADPIVGKDSSFPAFTSIVKLADSATSTDTSTSQSFNVPLPALAGAELALHMDGDALFEKKFNTESGVGPAFNAQTCVSCHARDGRGSLPVIPFGQTVVRLGSTEAILLRISLENSSGSKLVPGFTEQLFHRGVYDLRPDAPGSGQADIDMSYATSTFTYPDGRVVSLRKPVFKLVNGYDAVGGKKSALEDPDLRISPRMGPPMIGLGLIEAIDARDILALADPDDANGDGISGRPNMIDGKLGRFGWKANTSSIRNQVAGAFSNDMGIRSSILPVESISGTALFTSLIQRLGIDWKPLETELPDSSLDALEFYAATLAVPQRRNVEVPTVRNGARTFEKIGCTGCHTPHFRTSTSAGISATVRGLDIYPFSDELLHDMGDELADNRPDHLANGREWKTRPLWGIGKTQTINPSAGFLHDGRARNLEQAILYHGGEAAAVRTRFSNLNAPERQELISFLLSL